MCKAIVSAGGKWGMSIKVANFQTKEEAVAFITVQLNKILNNPEAKQWDVSMQEIKSCSVM